MSFTKMKFRISDKAESIRLQTALFQKGYSWYGHQDGVFFHIDAKFLFTNDTGDITYEQNDEEYFWSHKNLHILTSYYLEYNGYNVDAPSVQPDVLAQLKQEVSRTREAALDAFQTHLDGDEQMAAYQAAFKSYRDADTKLFMFDAKQ